MAREWRAAHPERVSEDGVVVGLGGDPVEGARNAPVAPRRAQEEGQGGRGQQHGQQCRQRSPEAQPPEAEGSRDPRPHPLQRCRHVPVQCSPAYFHVQVATPTLLRDTWRFRVV